MPGWIEHIYFAQTVYRDLSEFTNIDKIDFISGNLIPDLSKDKKQSHYRKKASIEGFFVPRLDDVKKDLFDLKSPLKLGIYCHLYLDYYFIENFLIPEFIWDFENMTVINPRNNKQWSAKDFFSNKGMYGAYSEINHLLIRDGYLNLSIMDEIPEILPNTGMSIFDIRIEKTWKEDLLQYLAVKKEYTGDIFDYNRLCNCIKQISDQFVEEIAILS